MPCALSLLPKSGGLAGCSFQRSCRCGSSALEYSAPSHALTHTHPLSRSLLPLPSVSHTRARARAHTHTHTQTHTYTHTHTHTHTQVTEEQAAPGARARLAAGGWRARPTPPPHPAPRTPHCPGSVACAELRKRGSEPGRHDPWARPRVSRAVAPIERFRLSAPRTAPRS